MFIGKVFNTDWQCKRDLQVESINFELRDLIPFLMLEWCKSKCIHVSGYQASEWRHVLRHNEANASVLTEDIQCWEDWDSQLLKSEPALSLTAINHVSKALLLAPASQGSSLRYLHLLRLESKNPLGCARAPSSLAPWAGCPQPPTASSRCTHIQLCSSLFPGVKLPSVNSSSFVCNTARNQSLEIFHTLAFQESHLEAGVFVYVGRLTR